ncbi:hypothetical protein [Paenibacillus sp. IHBB 10380]|uniref:hypothetical protein n=1 Tax=Paenibacillus sp. IHBB 10380 TaxID=1566358 RepID=UPI0005CFB499|nr:hypothetical protein [Paenibacillus sp. IHBB 10380]AJS58658.1 hypothetical protein UB51_09350 [Paenibacillus sp. IHBB 10380]
MYRELDNLISADTTVDSWYDDGCIIASEILSEFSPRDWEQLSSKVLTNSLEWQRKLAYCLDSNCNMYELKILLLLISTKDEELFEICIDTLRSFTTPESKQMILDNPSILHRVNDLLPKAGVAVKKILEEFLMKIHS